MNGELKERLELIENNYNKKDFLDIVNQVKKEKINDDELLEKIAKISQGRFKERVSFTFSVLAGNLLWIIITAVGIILPFQVNSSPVFYISALVLMTTLHPLSHYLAGSLLGIRFTHYYLNGPARIEPTLKIDYFSYLKTNGKKRAVMHVSGVLGTVLAPLIVAIIAVAMDANEVAFNLFILFILLVFFELLTSTKIGDLMRAKREYDHG